MSGRPDILWPLFAAVQSLDGIGPKGAQALAQTGIETPRDLLYTLPYQGIDRQLRASVLDVPAPATVTVKATIGLHRPARKRGGPYRIEAEDAATRFAIVFFHARGDYVQKLLPEGETRIVSGKVELFDGVPQMVHPDHVLPVDEADSLPAYEPVYPLTAGVTQKAMTRAAADALQRVPDLDEWADPALVAREGWPNWSTAVAQAHRPEKDADLAQTAPARARLAYDELLAHQVTLALARAAQKRRAGRSTRGTGVLQDRVIAVLPYRPTNAQTRAVSEIAADMAAAADVAAASAG